MPEATSCDIWVRSALVNEHRCMHIVYTHSHVRMTDVCAYKLKYRYVYCDDTHEQRTHSCLGARVWNDQNTHEFSFGNTNSARQNLKKCMHSCMHVWFDACMHACMHAFDLVNIDAQYFESMYACMRAFTDFGNFVWLVRRLQRISWHELRGGWMHVYVCVRKATKAEKAYARLVKYAQIRRRIRVGHTTPCACCVI